MQLQELCRALGCACPDGEEKRQISAIAVDSREVIQGSMFVCIRGMRTDGHSYIENAIARGAAYIVTQIGATYEKQSGMIFLEVPDTRKAAACLYHAWYGYPTKKMRIIGVTGTNGKTGVTCMIKAILEAAGKKCGLIGTLGCESAGRRLHATSSDPMAAMTTPDPQILYRLLAEMVTDGVQYVLMEATSHALALGKLEPIAFDMAVFTNLTPEHLDFHGDMEHYANAKAALFSKSQYAVINSDSPYADHMIQRTGGRFVTCSQHHVADYRAEAVESTSTEGVTYRLLHQGEHYHVFCPVSGDFQVMNSMQALAVAHRMGVPFSTGVQAIAAFAGVRGRMEKQPLGEDADISVFIDYAHTPDALERVLTSAKRFCQNGGRLVLLFGCGGDRDPTKRPEMAKLACRYCDRVIVTSDNSRSESTQRIISQILSGMHPETPYIVIPDRAEAIFFAICSASPRDVVLLVGKGHEEYEITKEGKRPFFERELVRRAMQARKQAQPTADSMENRS